MKDYRVPLVIFLVALAYYGVLCAKSYTWVFMSSDSGDWLAASNWWMVPQPYGSPLYILLGRLSSVFPGSLVLKMTIVLSVVPSAVTVALVYTIVHRLTSHRAVAMVSSVVLLGSAVFLTQSTVLEEYALTAMLLTLGTYWYLSDRRHLTAIAMSLCISVHVIVTVILVFWAIVEWKRRRLWLMPVVVLSSITVVMYSTILTLMALETPRLIAGTLDLYHLRMYLVTTTGAIVGQLSVFEAPWRLLTFARLMLVSLGLAAVPLVVGLRTNPSKSRLALVGLIMMMTWYYVTNLDSATWTFMSLAFPHIAIFVGIGLQKLGYKHTVVVAVSAVTLMTLNGVHLNANTLTDDKPLATELRQSLMGLPENSVVVTRAGSYSMGLMYALSEGKHLVPVIYPYLGAWKFEAYRLYINDTYGLAVEPNDTFLTVTRSLLEEGRQVYYADYVDTPAGLHRCFILGEGTQVREVVGLTGLRPKPEVEVLQ